MTELQNKLAAQKIKLRTGTSPRFERIRIVNGTLPEEVRFELAKKYQATVVEVANSQTEVDALRNEVPSAVSSSQTKLPSPKPDFWIPILMVLSYVVPFFLFLFLTLNTTSNRHLMSFLFPKWGPLLTLPIPTVMHFVHQSVFFRHRYWEFS